MKIEAPYLISYDASTSYSLQRRDSRTKVSHKVRDLTLDEAKILIESCVYVNQLDVFRGRILEVEMNLDDFMVAFENKFDHKMGADSTKVPAEDYRKRIINSDRLLRNYVMSWRSCIELMEKQIKNYYGAQSEKVVAFEQRTHEHFDNVFEYRLLTKLRNVGAHLDDLVKTLMYIPEKDRIIPMLSKFALVESDQFPKKHFQKDFDELPNEINTLMVVHQGIFVLRDLFWYVMELNRDFFIDNRYAILKVVGDEAYGMLGFSNGSIAQEVPLHLCHFISDHFEVKKSN